MGVEAVKIAPLFSGLLFGFGLALSTMIRPEIVLGFLRLDDLGLLLLMGGTVVVTFVTYRFAPRRLACPLWGGTFDTRESTMDRATVVGAALLGIGWGITGVCPGPSIAGLGAGMWELGYAIVGIALGALRQDVTASRAGGRSAS